MRRSLAIVVTFALGFTACDTPEDENYLWLLSLPNAGTGQGTEDLPVHVEVDDVAGDPDFLFDSTRDIQVFINVIDPRAPVAGSRVTIYELDENGNPVNTISFRAVTNENGNVGGTLTIDRTTNLVELAVTYQDAVHRMLIDVRFVQEIRRTLNILALRQPILVADRDSDGVPDQDDSFPDDPDRATTVYCPADGSAYTVAYEDLYPNRGDADFNDYVLRVRYELDLNAQGEVARIRGHYQHIARGAAYRHTLHLTLPGVSNAHLDWTRFDAAGQLLSQGNSEIADFTAIEMMPDSSTTIEQSNTSKTGQFRPGQALSFEVTLGAPILRSQLGPLPFDLFIHVLNTGHDVHFLGRYANVDGSDRFLDSAGFPWALMVPQNWRWPYEKENIHNGYGFFKDWYESRGTASADWFSKPDDRYVVPAF
ncbi:MAG: LruC domain-containing protein [Spirochaetales bacterium]|nr:LruC domain-containing protein [Spirochaetales bacterium]